MVLMDLSEPFLTKKRDTFSLMDKQNLSLQEKAQTLGRTHKIANRRSHRRN